MKTKLKTPTTAKVSKRFADRLLDMAATKKAIAPTADQEIASIAKTHLNLETLDTRNSDSLDFKEVSVWGVSAALTAAYNAGVAANGQPTTRSEKQAANLAATQNAFIARKANIDALLIRLQDASESHFNASPDDLNWGNVGDLARIEELLTQACTNL